jgi:hypothetical protein
MNDNTSLYRSLPLSLIIEISHKEIIVLSLSKLRVPLLSPLFVMEMLLRVIVIFPPQPKSGYYSLVSRKKK